MSRINSVEIAATVEIRTLGRPPIQAAWDQTLFKPFERYLFARFRDVKCITEATE
jgi:hypothetical protein